MVLSSTYSIPPQRYPPSVLESLAAIAENLSKLSDTIAVNNAKLAASQSKLNDAIQNYLATQNKRLAASTDNIETEAQVNIDATSPRTTFTANEFNDYTVNTKTDITETTKEETNTPTVIMPPPNITLRINKNEEQDKTNVTNPTQNTLQVQLANSLKPCGLALCIISGTNPSTNFPSTQNHIDGLRLKCLATSYIQAYCQQQEGKCVCCPHISHVYHQCCPPKLVFLRAEPKPPWKLHETRGTQP